jgi:hypothetical protein
MNTDEHRLKMTRRGGREARRQGGKEVRKQGRGKEREKKEEEKMQVPRPSLGDRHQTGEKPHL